MNIILNPDQSDTKRGDISDLATVNLTGLENYLVKLVSGGFALPTATDDIAPYVVMSGDVAGNSVGVEAPGLGENFRGVLKGTCVKGALLSLADPSTPADAGKLRTQPTTTGTWRSFAIAEEAGVDGQHILARRIPERTAVVS